VAASSSLWIAQSNHDGLRGPRPYALAGLWSRYFEGDDTRYSFTVSTTEPNEFMKPIHEKAMPVILTNIDEQKLWLTDGVIVAVVFAGNTRVKLDR